jgi:predicted N-formylglutamate amidohydrolase
VLEVGRAGSSPFVIAVDHASPRVPRRLGNLGLSPAEFARHIAWDIGALAVARKVAVELDAPLVAQNYSRLIIDCNRDPSAASSVPVMAESAAIPGNIGLPTEEVIARREEIFQPYHDHLRALLDERQRAGRRTILVAQHSMTDVFKGIRRQMHAAVLYNRDRRFAGIVLEILRRESGLIVAENEPYSWSGSTYYNIPQHAEAVGLHYVEIEIRQDLIVDEAGHAEWARLIGRALQDAAGTLFGHKD